MDRELDIIIFRCLLLDGNEIYTLENKDKWNKLIVELVKLKMDVRWCTIHNCQCHPEYQLKELLKDEDLSNFISKDIVLSNLYYILDKTDQTKTVYGEDGNSIRRY